MDLTESLLSSAANGHAVLPDPSVLADEATLSVTLKRVQGLLAEKNEFLRRTLREHQGAINGYAAQVSQLHRGHDLLREEAVRLKALEFGDPVPGILAGYTEAAAAAARFQTVSPEEYSKGELRNGLLLWVRDLAMLRDFEKDVGVLQLEKVRWRGKAVKASLPISRKTKQLVATLLARPAAVPLELLVEALNLYIQACYLAFEEQLAGLPHLAALFHNDTQFLLQLAVDRLPGGHQCGAILQQWSLTGALVLQSQVQRQATDIRERILPDAAALGSDGEREAVQRASGQVLMRLGQLGRIWAPILDEAVYQGVMSELHALLIEWLWSLVCSVDYLTPSLVGFIAGLCKEPLAQSAAYLPASEARRQLEAYLEAMGMGLMQLSNWARRGHFGGRLGSRQLMRLVEALFADSASRQAALDDLAEDLADDDDDDDDD